MCVRDPTTAVPARSWLDPRVTVRPSGIHGLGLFAGEPVRRGEVLEILGGSTHTNSEVEGMLRRGERYDGIALDVNCNLRIAPADWPGIHGNHSCNPNLWMRDHITIETRYDISTGDELTIDYAIFSISPLWSMPCRCGSSLCRGVVTGSDWRRPELEARYRGHLAPVVARLLTSA